MKIVIATQKTEEAYKHSQEGKCLADYYWSLSDAALKDHLSDVVIIENNKEGLSKVYNEELLTCEDDICVFMHDDVEIHDLFFYEKLKKAHETYDIVGVAGATKQVYTKDKPSLWHMACDNFIWGNNGGDGRGFITTPINRTRMMSQTFFGPTPSEVNFIDGCFISFKVDKIKKAGLKFDEDFAFHHYDLQMCLDAKKKGLKIGVWPIFLIHKSPGLLSLTDEKFVNSDRKFKEKNLK